VLRDKALLDGDEVVVVMSKSEREAAGHNRRKSGVATAEARASADMAHAALTSPNNNNNTSTNNTDSKRSGDGGDVTLQHDHMSNIDMDAAAALGIHVASPKAERIELGRIRRPGDAMSPRSGDAGSGITPRPDAASSSRGGIQPAPGTFVTIDLHDNPLQTPLAMTSSSTTTGGGGGVGVKRRTKKKGTSSSKTTKKKRKKVLPSGITATPNVGEDEVADEEIGQLVRQPSDIPIDARARAKVASRPPVRRVRSPSSTSEEQKGDTDTTPSSSSSRGGTDTKATPRSR
jgi:hypothetical protein